MKDVGMWEWKWITIKDRYLLAMDSLKYVVARRQDTIMKERAMNKNYHNSPDYYKIWSCPGHMIGQQKLRG